MSKTWTMWKKFFVVEVTLTGFLCLAASVVCPILAWQGVMPPVMIAFAIVAFYQVWNTFIAIANPESVTIDENSITFSAWGRNDRYEFDDLKEFRVREFPTAGKMYIRVNDHNLLHGRYWLQTHNMDDGRELFQIICDMEYKIHPDTIKARARRTNTEYLEVEQKLEQKRAAQKTQGDKQNTSHK